MSSNLREKYGVYSKSMAAEQRFRFVTANKMAIGVVNDAMKLHDEDEKLQKLKSFRESLNSQLREISAQS